MCYDILVRLVVNCGTCLKFVSQWLSRYLVVNECNVVDIGVV